MLGTVQRLLRAATGEKSNQITIIQSLYSFCLLFFPFNHVSLVFTDVVEVVRPHTSNSCQLLVYSQLEITADIRFHSNRQDLVPMASLASGKELLYHLHAVVEVPDY